MSFAKTFVHENWWICETIQTNPLHIKRKVLSSIASPTRISHTVPSRQFFHSSSKQNKNTMIPSIFSFRISFYIFSQARQGPPRTKEEPKEVLHQVRGELAKEQAKSNFRSLAQNEAAAFMKNTTLHTLHWAGYINREQGPLATP